MRLAILAAAAAMLCAGAANAEQAGRQAANQASAAPVVRVVYVCDRSAENKRSWAREHGEEMTFVSAQELAKAEAAQEVWSTPRCITEDQLDRYERSGGPGRVVQAKADR